MPYLPGAPSLDTVLKVTLTALLTGQLAAGGSLGGPLGVVSLPSPEAAQVQQSSLIQAVGGLPDRLLRSRVPGSVVNNEIIYVGLAGNGRVSRVSAEQRLALQGTGDYAIRERGPARSATSLSTEPAPLTHRGAVVWTGFSPGHRDLGARLVLDPQVEAEHLPLSVQVSFTGRNGQLSSPEGGQLPGAGTVTVTLSNVTAQPTQLPTGSDVAAGLVAPALDRAWLVARHPTAVRLPSTSIGLPTQLTVSSPARVQASQAVALYVTGALHFSGTTATVSGPAIDTSGAFAGTLGGVQGSTSVTFTAEVAEAATMSLEVTAVNALNPAELAPPHQLGSWSAWARSSPPLAERKAALDLLVEVAASGARDASYSPYLGADLLGTGATTFTFAFAPAAAMPVVVAALQPHWGALALVALALLLLLSGGVVVWRRS